MYEPQLNDYCKWRNVEGWVYFVDPSYYLTLEMSVKDKPPCEYTKSHKHKKVHCCLVVYCQHWDELTYCYSRKYTDGGIEIYTRPIE